MLSSSGPAQGYPPWTMRTSHSLGSHLLATLQPAVSFTILLHPELHRFGGGKGISLFQRPYCRPSWNPGELYQQSPFSTCCCQDESHPDPISQLTLHCYPDFKKTHLAAEGVCGIVTQQSEQAICNLQKQQCHFQYFAQPEKTESKSKTWKHKEKERTGTKQWDMQGREEPARKCT